MSDQELIESFLRGDEDAFVGLMSKYQRLVFHTIKGILLNNDTAQEVTQETFIKAFNKLNALKDRNRFRSWLLRIALNLAYDQIKRQQDEFEFDDSFMAPTTDSEKLIIARDLAERVKKVIAQLAPKQRMILSLHLFREMKSVEIADLLELNPATVRSNLHFGMKNLRETLHKQQVI